MKRNGDKIISRRGQKYELDRSNWTTYQNFCLMYDDIEEELIHAGLAEKLDAPVWMDGECEECLEGESKGCKVTIKITHPEMCLAADEV